MIMSNYGVFRKATWTTVNGALKVSKYVSSGSGLTVVVADAQRPIVSAAICLATEAQSNDGFPHTLEHLVFMGSHSYPWKGCLDMIANRCLASGTNACTDTDHTYYTLSTAGSQGFLTLLPIYLDHIFRPLLTESHFTTEVHHVTGDGLDSGVVYSEMQEYEHDMDEQMAAAVRTNLYPANSGYHYETGGMLKPLRETCTNQKIREFHSAFYRPENVSVIVVGQINHEQLLAVIEKHERDWQATDRNVVKTLVLFDHFCIPFTRPFRTEIPKLTESKTLSLTCPSDDESAGLVHLVWLGPPSTDVRTMTSLELLLDHLSSSAVSPLQQSFVQCDTPICSEVYSHMKDQFVVEFSLEFRGVQVEELEKVAVQCEQVVEKVMNGQTAFDVHRLRHSITRRLRAHMLRLEKAPDPAITDCIIGEFLYGETEQNFVDRLDEAALLNDLLGRDEQYWIGLMQQYLGPDNHKLVAIGRPSEKLIEEYEQSEKQRIETRKKQMGEAELAKCQQTLDDAIRSNEENVPSDSFLTECSVNSLDEIAHVQVTQASNLLPDAQGHVLADFQLNELPFACTVADCNTNFVKVNVVMDTSDLSVQQRALLLPLCELIFQSPVTLGNGQTLSYEQVVKELDEHLLSEHAACGLNGSFLDKLLLVVNMHVSEYKIGVHWLTTALHRVQFNESRIAVILKQLLNNVAEEKRDAHTMCSLLLSLITNEQNSNHSLLSAVRLESHLKYLLNLTKKQPTKVVAAFNELYIAVRDALCHVHVTADIKQLTLNGIDGASDLMQLQGASENGVKRAKLSQGHGGPPSYVKGNRFGHHSVMTIGSSDACYIKRVARLDDVPGTSMDYAALLIAVQYLSQTESPLWREIRGKGWAYGAGIRCERDEALIVLNLYRCSQPVDAITRSQQSEHIHGSNAFVLSELESARRSLVYELVESIESVHHTSNQTFIAHIRGAPQDNTRALINRVWSVSASQVQSAAASYLPRLLDAAKSNTAVVCHPSKLKQVTDGFQSLGVTLEPYKLSDVQCVDESFKL